MMIPQLMPMYWMLSSFMILIFFIMMIISYGDGKINSMLMNTSNKKMMHKWFW